MHARHKPVSESRHRWLEVSSLIAFAVVAVHVLFQLVRPIDSPWQLPGLCVSLLVGYFLADLISGLAHWAGDSLGNEQTPVFGKTFIQPFRHHHVDPTDITRHDFVETNGNNSIIALPLLLLTAWVMPENVGWLYHACVASTAIALLACFTNQIHKWAHLTAVPRSVLWLQRWRVLLSPEHHRAHHHPPHDRHYCITTGWMDAPMARFKVIEALQRLVGRKRGV